MPEVRQLFHFWLSAKIWLVLKSKSLGFRLNLPIIREPKGTGTPVQMLYPHEAEMKQRSKLIIVNRVLRKLQKSISFMAK